MEENRIARHLFGSVNPHKSSSPVPDLTGPTVGVLHTGTDIVVHWIDKKSIHYVNFNSIFGFATKEKIDQQDAQ